MLVCSGALVFHLRAVFSLRGIVLRTLFSRWLIVWDGNFPDKKFVVPLEKLEPGRG
jgi:hypothetical protein